MDNPIRRESSFSPWIAVMATTHLPFVLEVDRKFTTIITPHQMTVCGQARIVTIPKISLISLF